MNTTDLTRLKGFYMGFSEPWLDLMRTAGKEVSRYHGFSLPTGSAQIDARYKSLCDIIHRQVDVAGAGCWDRELRAACTLLRTIYKETRCHKGASCTFDMPTLRARRRTLVATTNVLRAIEPCLPALGWQRIALSSNRGSTEPRVTITVMRDNDNHTNELIQTGSDSLTAAEPAADRGERLC